LASPCSYITLYENKLFFLDETDSQLYKFDLATNKTSIVIKEESLSFIIKAGTIYYATDRGLMEHDLQRGKSSLLTDHIPLCLGYAGSGLIFADRSHDFCLSGLVLGQKEPRKINHIKTQSIATDGQYIYASNLLDNSSIVRVDSISGEAIRFCGEKADKLHIIGNHLYFLNQNDKNAWYKMPLSGGRAIRLLQPPA
jgi:hypothetical protein